MPVEACVQSLCDLALRFGENDDEEDAMSRPFGVALLVAGIDADGPVLYHTDPSGTYVRYMAKAIGSASEGAQTALQDSYNKVRESFVLFCFQFCVTIGFLTRIVCSP
jgi:20S proteasome subunit alpha 5